MTDQLPEELILQILEFSRVDKESLYTLALLSRHFLGLTRPYLFYDIKLERIPPNPAVFPDKQYIDKFRKLYDVINNNPELATYTRVLHIHLEPFNSKPRPRRLENGELERNSDADLLPPFLGYFNRVETLTLSASSHEWPWYSRRFKDSFEPDILAAIVKWIQSPTIRSLRLEMYDFPMSYIQGSSNLTALDLRGINLRLAIMDPASSSQGRAGKRLEGFQPTFLAIGGVNYFEEAEMKNLDLDVSQVKHLVVAPSKHEFDKQSFVLYWFLSKAESLVNLTWVPVSEDLTVYKNIQLRPTIHSFEFDVSRIGYDRFLGGGAFGRHPIPISEFLIQALGSLPIPCPIRNLTIRVALTCMRQANTDVGRASLAVLEDLLLSQFESVEWVTVSWTLPRPEVLFAHKDDDRIPVDVREAMPTLYGSGRFKLSDADGDQFH